MMDSFGRVSEENKKRLDTLDSAQEISLPEISLQVPAADSVQDTVMNYHIACYCQAYAISDTAAAALEGRRTRAGGEAGRGDKQ